MNPYSDSPYPLARFMVMDEATIKKLEDWSGDKAITITIAGVTFKGIIGSVKIRTVLGTGRREAEVTCIFPDGLDFD